MSPLYEKDVNAKPVILILVLLLVVMMIYSSYAMVEVAFALKVFRTDTLCTKGGVPTNGPDADKCCYFATYEFDDGSPIGTFEYCADCHNEGGQLSCGDFECVVCKRLPPGSDLPQLEQVPPVLQPLSPQEGVLQAPAPEGGDIPTLEQVPPSRTLPGGGDLPTLEQGPGLNQGTEGEPPLPVVCSEEAGLEKDPETGQCVPIEPGGLPQLEQVPPNGILPGGGDIPTLEPGPGFSQGTEGEPPLPVVCSEEAGLELDEETGQCVPIEPPVTEQPDEPEEQSSDDGEGGEEQSNEEQQQPSEEEGSGSS